MKQYPYIGNYETTNTETLCLFYKEGFAINLADKQCVGTDRYREGIFTNITPEFLSNTWGVVESKEHAEFIIELAELHGFELIKMGIGGCNFFNFGSTSFALLSGEPVFKGDCKQITIPPPPKASYNIEVKNNTELNVDITRNKDAVSIMIDKETPKAELPEAGHNLVFAPEQDLKAARNNAKELRKKMNCSDELLSKEWPCVNDTVTWGNKVCSGVVKAIDGDLAWIKNEYGNYVTEYVDKLQKPKTPEKALRDNIIELTLSHMENKSHPIEANAYYLFSDLLTKYNITPKEV